MKYNPTCEIEEEFLLYREVFKQFPTAKLVSSALEMEDELLFISVCLTILATLGYDIIMINGKICKNLKTTLLKDGRLFHSLSGQRFGLSMISELSHISSTYFWWKIYPKFSTEYSILAKVLRSFTWIFMIFRVIFHKVSIGISIKVSIEISLPSGTYSTRFTWEKVFHLTG